MTQFVLNGIREGLWHRVCRSAIGCKPVPRYPDLGIVEYVPWCETCGRFVSVKELA